MTEKSSNAKDHGKKLTETTFLGCYIKWRGFPNVSGQEVDVGPTKPSIVSKVHTAGKMRIHKQVSNGLNHS